MKYEKMMEKNLANHFGITEKVSEVDALVFADDQILVDRFAEKDARAIRIGNKKNHKNRRKALYEMRSAVSNYAHRTYWDRDDTVGIVPIFKNAESDTPVAFVKKGRRYEWEHLQRKQKNHKIRYERFSTPEPIIGEITRVSGVTLAEGDVWKDKWDDEWKNTIGFRTNINKLWEDEAKRRYDELWDLRIRAEVEIRKIKRKIKDMKEKIAHYEEDINCINDMIVDLWTC